MKKTKKVRPFPISQRHLAAYLGISPTLLSMIQTGRHGTRQLPSPASGRLSELQYAYHKVQQASPQSGALKKIQSDPGPSVKQSEKEMMRMAKEADLKAGMLRHKLDDMVAKEKENALWLVILNLVLEDLPGSDRTVKALERDRRWLESQRSFALARLQKNGHPQQVKLEALIETEKQRARIYQEAGKRLLKYQ